MGRQRRIIKMDGNRYYEGAEIKQANPHEKFLGIGPYHLIYKEKEVVRLDRHSECRDHLEEIVKEKWQIDRKIFAMKAEFAKKWNLKDYPEDF